MTSATIISPTHDGTPLNHGLASLPNGYTYGGKLYLRTHVNTMGVWKPPGHRHQGAGEVSFLYTIELDRLGDPNLRATFVRQSSPGAGFAGVGSWCQDDAACVGRKFYQVTLAVTGEDWDGWDFGSIYLGAARDPLAHPRWQKAPILRRSTVAGVNLGWLYTPALKSFEHDPPPPSRFFPRKGSGFGPMHMWGYVVWGPVPGGPYCLARIQIADYSPTLAPRWPTTRVRMLAADGEWRFVKSGGVVDFMPYDAREDFPGLGHNLSSIHFAPDWGWTGLGISHYPERPDDPGVDERVGWWWTNPKSQFYHQHLDVGNFSSVPLSVNLEGGSSYEWSQFASRNMSQIGAFMFEHDDDWWMVRATTDRIAQEAAERAERDPNDPYWWNPWVGCECVLDRL